MNLLFLILFILIICSLAPDLLCLSPKPEPMHTARVQIKMLGQALDSYRLDVGKYPNSLQGLFENDSRTISWQGPYLKKKVPDDPWGNSYQYIYPGKHNNDYDLYSFGADGREGGEGADADIVNW
jgi:general secretion pathway protein G